MALTTSSRPDLTQRRRILMHRPENQYDEDASSDTDLKNLTDEVMKLPKSDKSESNGLNDEAFESARKHESTGKFNVEHLKKDMTIASELD